MNRFVDIHANILPNLHTVGQKAPTMEQAVERLMQAEASSIKTMIATPFYDPDEFSSVDDFFASRSEQIAALNAFAVEKYHPVRILGGSVLRYTPDILQMGESLRRFGLADSRYMLLDLPDMNLTEEFFDNMKKCQLISGLTPILADFDRFYNTLTLEDFFAFHEAGMLVQISAQAILNPETRRLSLYLLGNQNVHFVASGSLAPDVELNLADAMRTTQRNLPADIYRRIKNNSGMLLSDAAPSEFL